MRKYLFIASIVVFTLCCKGKQTTVADNIVAKAFDKTLKVSDIKNIIELSKNSPDSIEYIRNYLKNWAIDEILYREAADYYKNDEQINRQVEEYRQTLILNKYKQVLIKDNSHIPADEDIIKFYAKNKGRFLLTEPMIKGAVIRISNNSPNIKRLHDNLKKTDQKSIDEIERLSLKQPFDYSFFLEKWTSLTTMSYLVPKQIIDNYNDLKPNTIYEYKDEAFVYLIKIVDILPKDAEMPLELAKTEIAFLLQENNDKTFIDNYLNNMLEKQQKKGNVVINFNRKK
jgi:hypothetical protein